MQAAGQPHGRLDDDLLSPYAESVGKRIAVRKRTVAKDGSGRHGIRAGVIATAFPLIFAGCMQRGPQTEAPPSQRTGIPQHSPRRASVAFVGFDGGSEERTQRFATMLAESAAALDVTAAPSANAHYFLRGYLTATPMQDGGVRLAYVGDLFDRRKQRAQRLSGGMTIPARGDDPWAAADDLKIRALATQGAQELAETLAGMPEAGAPTLARPTPLTPSGGVTAVARQTPAPSPPAPAMHANHTSE